MTRGNQRELARAKNQKKQQKQGKGKQDLKGMTVTQKKESDAAIMRAKQEAAVAKKEQESGKK
ncbi:small EDRK-rich factor 1-like protein [Circinella umbellata]|nr:small EDRK-rich factor 1-like protein [Circinella umbellata]